MLADLRVGTAPAANVNGLVTIGEADIRITQRVQAAGLEALAIDAVIGVPGKGLRTLAKERPQLMRAPLSGEVRLVEHAIGDWKKALSASGIKVPDLPGNVGGVLTLGGDLTTPTVDGAFTWDGFETVAAPWAASRSSSRPGPSAPKVASRSVASARSRSAVAFCAPT